MIQEGLLKRIESKFVTLPGERLILAERKHWSIFAAPLALLFIFGIFSITALFIAYSAYSNYWFVFLPTILLTATFILSLGTRSVIDWYFHMYIVTNRKIMELSYSPLSSHQVNSILLDQVKCTEIDTRIDGIVNDFLDIGHVVITFDRPTHKDAFILEHLYNPEKVESFLQNALYPVINADGIQPIYLGSNTEGIYNKSKNSPGKWTYIEDIIPLKGESS